MILKLPRAVGTVLLLTTFLACGGSSPTAPESRYDVDDFLSGVTLANGIAATHRSGNVAPASGGPSVTADGNANIINGGSNLVRLRSSTSFQVVYLYVSGTADDPGGFWELRLPASTVDITIVVSFGRTLPSTAFNCVFVVATSSGQIGAPRSLNYRVQPAATGAVQVSASWDALSDVDLHVVEPSGREIYFADSTSPTGGALDLDSNAGCSIDGVNNENIRWPTGQAPAGTYTVRLEYWDSCNVLETNYVVTVHRSGTVSVFTGVFTGGGTGGGLGAGRQITSFSFSASGSTLSATGQSAPRFPFSRPESLTKVGGTQRRPQ